MTRSTRGPMGRLAAEYLRPANTLVALFPGKVVGFETRAPVPEALLHPEEASFVSSAVEKRRQEFAGGRICARRALEELDIFDFPLVVGKNRFPIWPEGTRGSITHTRGYCASLVANSRHYDGIGIDVEQRGRLDRRLEGRICTEEEQSWLASLPASERIDMATVLFSAKEAFYKSQYCVTRKGLGFHDAVVRVEGDCFEVKLRKPVEYFRRRKEVLRGRFAIGEAHVFAAIGLRVGSEIRSG